MNQERMQERITELRIAIEQVKQQQKYLDEKHGDTEEQLKGLQKCSETVKLQSKLIYVAFTLAASVAVGASSDILKNLAKALFR